MEVSRAAYVTDIFVPLVGRLTFRYRPFAEFVEVVLLPLDEFQTKIDGESLSRSRAQSQQTHWHLSFCVLIDVLKKEKIIVDAKVYIFGMGMAQAFFKPKELPVLKQ